MTKPELDALARRIFPRLPHPERPDEPWWTPGQICDIHGKTHPDAEVGIPGIVLACRHGQSMPHEIPSPDYKDWEVFGQLLTYTLAQGVSVQFKGKWVIIEGRTWSFDAEADDIREALLHVIAKASALLTSKGVAE